MFSKGGLSIISLDAGSPFRYEQQTETASKHSLDLAVSWQALGAPF